MNEAERPEDAARRFAGELGRLAVGLKNMGYELRDGPLAGCEVDTALSIIRGLKEAYETWMEKATDLDEIVSAQIRLLRSKGYVQ